MNMILQDVGALAMSVKAYTNDSKEFLLAIEDANELKKIDPS